MHCEMFWENCRKLHDLAFFVHFWLFFKFQVHILLVTLLCSYIQNVNKPGKIVKTAEEEEV
jgi:hypothetical protein